MVFPSLFNLVFSSKLELSGFFREKDIERSPELVVPVHILPLALMSSWRRGGWERKQAVGSAVGRNFSQRVTPTLLLQCCVMDPALAPLPSGTQPNWREPHKSLN